MRLAASEPTLKTLVLDCLIGEIDAYGPPERAASIRESVVASITHGLVFAGAGGFKSTSIAVPTLVRWPHSIITLDPSNELAPMTIAARKKMRRDVIVVSPNDPESGGFNVLSWIDPETSEADDNVASVVQWIAGDDQMRAGSGENHFFISRGLALVTCLLSALSAPALPGPSHAKPGGQGSRGSLARLQGPGPGRLPGP